MRTHYEVLLTFVFVLNLYGLLNLESLRAQERQPTLDKVIHFEFPKNGYTFDAAELAQGVEIPYKIVVTEDIAGIMPQPFPPSYAEPAGASGLHPRQQISGQGQLYCLKDEGRGFPPSEEDSVPKLLKKGTYAHSLKWDGRNWTGPSDFGNPKGKPFPKGTYEMSIIIHGEIKSDEGKIPYKLTSKTKVVIK